MAETVEELLLGIGLDPKSLQAFTAELQKVKAQVQSKPIEVGLKVDSGATQSISAAMGSIVKGAEEAKVALAALGASIYGIQSFFRHASAEAAEGEKAARKLEIAFGSLGAKALETSGKLAETFKSQDNAASEALSRMGMFIQGFGVGQAESLNFAESIATAAFTMAKALGEQPLSMLNQLQGALIRGGRFAKQLGLDLSNAAVDAKALSLGFDPATMSQVEQIQAKIAIVVERAGKYAAESAGKQKLFQTSLIELSDAAADTAETFGKFVNEALQPFIEALTEGITAVKKFVAEHPRLTKVVAVSGVAVGGLITAFGGLTAGVLAVSGAMKALEILKTASLVSWGALVSVVTNVASAIAFLIPEMITFASSLAIISFNALMSGLSSLIFLLGPVGLVAAAAAAGYALGTIIDKALGISNAVAKATAQSTALRIEQEKAASLGVIWRNNADAVDLYNRKIAEGKNQKQAETTATEFAYLSEKIKRAGGDVELFTQLVGHGAPLLGAFGAALGGTGLLFELHANKAKLSAAQMEQYELILTALHLTTKDLDEATNSAAKSTEDHARATKLSAEAEKERKKSLEDLTGWLKKSEEQQITSSTAIVDSYAKTVNAFADAANRAGQGSAQWSEGLNAIKIASAKAMADMSENIAKQVAAQRALYQQQVSDARAAKDQLIATYDQQLARYQQTLGQLKPAADRGNEALKNFSEQARRDSLAAVDSRLVEIDSIKKTLTESLKTATSMEARTQAIKDANAQLDRQGQVTDEQKRLEQDVATARANRAAAEAKYASDASTGYDTVAAAIKRQQEAEKALDEKIQTQVTVAMAIADAKKAIAAADDASRATVVANAKTIAETEKQILALQERKAAAVLAEAQAEVAYGQALANNVGLLKIYFDMQGELIKLEEKRARAKAVSGSDSPLVQSIDAQIQDKLDRLKGVQSDLNAIQQRQTVAPVQKEINATEQVVNQNQKQEQAAVNQAQLENVKALQDVQVSWAADMKNASDALAISLANVQPEFAAATEQLASIQAELPTITSNIQGFAAAQWSVSDAIGGLADVLANRFTDVIDATRQNAKDILDLKDLIKNVKIPKKGGAGAPGDTEMATAGLEGE